MSGTRHAATDAELSQERWCSAPEFNHSLNAIAVAKRAQLVRDPELKALLWFLQWRSLRPNGLEEVARDLLALYPERIGTPTLRRLGGNLEKVCTPAEVRQLRSEGFEGFLLAGEVDERDSISGPIERPYANPKAYLARDFSSVVEREKEDLVDHLQRICLDPGFVLGEPWHGQREQYSPDLWWFDDLIGAISDYRKRSIEKASARIATTDVSTKISETLGFCFRQRRMVLVEGNPGLGKSITSKTWCETQGGLARWFEAPSGDDTRSFYVQIAQALGVANGPSYTAFQIKFRVEKALLESGLMLICDEASRLWPQYNRPSKQPARMLWIMSMFEAGTPIAMTGYKFSDWRSHYTQKTNWPDDQLERRLNRTVQLPGAHSESDLFQIAEAILPHGDHASHTLLAGVARVNPRKGASAMVEIIATARDFVEQEGSPEITFDVIQRAIATNHPDLVAQSEPSEKALRSRARSSSRIAGLGDAGSLPPGRIAHFDDAGRRSQPESAMMATEGLHLS